MEESIILRGRYRQLQDSADEVRHHGAAAAALRIQMRHVGNRHVIRKLECVKPVGVAVEDSGAKPPSPITLRVVVDALRAPQEPAAIVKKVAVMIQVVNVDLKPSLPDEEQKA